MARGFESKSVEFQQEEAERVRARRREAEEALPGRAALAGQRRTLELQLARAEADLRLAKHPAHRELLERSLLALREQFAALPQGRMKALAGLLLASVPLAAQAQSGAERVRIENERSVVFFEPGLLSKERMERFAQLVDAGIVDIQNYLKVELPPPRRADDSSKITYYVGSQIGMSRAYRRSVLLPIERVADDSAPYLHETTHVLLPVRNRCVWLSEGFASYVQSYVAEHVGGYDGYVFSRGGNAKIDQLARRHLGSARGREVLAYVGEQGQPPEMESDRWGVAAPFYVLSHSFSKFLVEKLGIEKVKAMLGVPDPSSACEDQSGRSVALWKADWLASLEGKPAAPSE